MWTAIVKQKLKVINLIKTSGPRPRDQASLTRMCVNAKYVCDAVDHIMSRITGPRWCLGVASRGWAGKTELDQNASPKTGIYRATMPV